jgi:hypothetical protein
MNLATELIIYVKRDHNSHQSYYQAHQFIVKHRFMEMDIYPRDYLHIIVLRWHLPVSG